jgi:hypothetical protein
VQEKKNPQTEANKRYQSKDRERTRYLRNRSTARNFYKNQATKEDIEEAETIISERKKSLGI